MKTEIGLDAPQRQVNSTLLWLYAHLWQLLFFGLVGAAVNTHAADNATLVSQTIADGAVMAPGQTFTQSWILRNTGTTTWSPGSPDGFSYSFNRISGDSIGGADGVLLSDFVPPGGRVTLSVDFTAPAAPGTYTGYWRMQSEAGNFGPTVKVLIRVALSGGNDATLVSQTIPDGTIVNPGQTFTKTWTLRNTGTTTWTPGDPSGFDYSFNRVGRDEIGGTDGMLLANPVAPNGQVTLIADLVAPTTPGTYTSYWSMQSTLGNFGETVHVTITVPPAGGYTFYSVTFAGLSMGTSISDQYSSFGVLFSGSGSGPFITYDTANPRPRVLSGSPRFFGSITATFVQLSNPSVRASASNVNFDAGYFNTIGSTRITWFGTDSQTLGSMVNTQRGIQHIDLPGSIGGFTIQIIGSEPAGFAINNVSFGFPPTLTLPAVSLPTGNVGVPYAYQLQAIGGLLPLVWTLPAGLHSLPDGLSLSATGLLSGISRQSGTFRFSVLVTDSAGAAASENLAITISGPPKPPVPTASPTTDTPAPGLTDPPVGSSSSHLVSIVGDQLNVDPGKVTIVLTHGWRSSSDDWPKKIIGNSLIDQGFGVTANIVAWDWRDNAGYVVPLSSAQRTPAEGDSLGSALLDLLGSSYKKGIHFVGHSLGAMVNCRAADFLHNNGFDWHNTHITMFDEAELVEAFKELHVLVDVLYAGSCSGAALSPWFKVIPEQAAWIDNYISEVGLLHSEAVNVFLWRRPAVPLISDFIGDTGLHGYGYTWYSKSITSSQVSQVGHRWSFERNSMEGRPRNSYFMQSLRLEESPLVTSQINFDTANILSCHRIVAYTSLASYQALNELNSTITYASLYLSGVIQYAGNCVVDMVEIFKPPIGQAVFSGIANSTPAYYVPETSPQNQSVWDLQFTLRKESAPQIWQPQTEPKLAGKSVYAWVPVKVPEGARTMGFQYRVANADATDYFTVGVSNQSVLTFQTKYTQPGTWTAASGIDVSEYAGQTVKLFFSLNSMTGYPPGQLDIRGIVFFLPVTPKLDMSLSSGRTVFTWPATASDWNLEVSPRLGINAEWSVLTNRMRLSDYEIGVTNDASKPSEFFRLRK